MISCAAEVRHIDLAQPLPQLALQSNLDSVLAVFWYDRVPLGSRLFTRGELPVPASGMTALAATAVAPALVARGVNSLEDLRPAPAPDVLLPISVIVCTRDRPRDLARCLASLQACEPPPDEIIVVDNAPATDDTRALVAQRPGVTYVLEPVPGLSRARNAGVAVAAGELVVFTDDDVEVSANWLAVVAAGFADAGVGAVTGAVVPATLDSPAAATFELTYGGLTSGFLPAQYDAAFLKTTFGEAPQVWKIGAGANMAIRRQALEAAGPFDERLGAGAAGCSEDSEMMHRLLLAGWTCRFDPAAVVFHWHRDSLPALRRQLRGYMRGHAAALLVQFGQTGAAGNLMRAFVGLPGWYIFMLANTVWTRDWLRLKLLPLEFCGLIEGWFSLLRYRRSAPNRRVRGQLNHDKA